MSNLVDGHYQRMAERYDSYLSYSGDFVKDLAETIVEMLKIQPEDRFADVGGGTGLYTKAILDLVPLKNRPLVVDPIGPMLEAAPDDLDAELVQAGAVEFVEQPGTYDKILMKETVHHIQDRARLCAGFYERLAPGGAVLLVHIPPKIDYPLFDAALERSLTWHANPDDLVALLEGAGFAVSRDRYEHHHSIGKDVYFQMVEHQYMTLLSSFTSDEIAAGLEEMAERYRDTDRLEFTDRFDCILGHKL